jgi:imidazolonepropionase-like amidohydrolase
MTKLTTRLVPVIAAIIAAAIVAGAAGLAAQPRPVTILEGATVIDGVSAAPIRNAVVEIVGERIGRIGAAGSFAIPANATRVNLAGRTVMPGIINAHRHLFYGSPLADDPRNMRAGTIAQNARRLLYYGVTHVLSLGLDGPAMDDYRREQAAGRTVGTFVLTAGLGSSAKNGWQASKEIHRPTTAEEGRAAVRAEVARHVDAIKFWLDDDHGKLPKLTPDIYGAIIDEAHKNHLPVYCHMFTLADAKALMRRGLDVFAHSVRDQEVDDEFIALARQHKVVQIPTLVGHAQNIMYAQRPAYLDDPGVAALYPRSLIEYLGGAEKQRKVADDPATPAARREFAIAEKNLRRIAAAGIPIAYGTDLGGLYGPDDHRELALMVESGMTPMQTIQAATIGAAKLLRLDAAVGSLRPGKRADLIVLSADPLSDIRNTTKIEAVWVKGARVNREALATPDLRE